MNTKDYLYSAVLAIGVALSATSFAQAPAGATGECKDGSYSKSESKRGACGKHGGVKEWYENNRSTEKAAAAPEKSESTRTATPQTKTNADSNAAGRTTAATGGGPGQVWVNTRSKVYHCQADKWYGKTIKGEYMSEADAKAKGAHADHGKACS